jgi:periplasmic protein CpxP/Spy
MTRIKTLDTTRMARWAAASVMVVAGIMASVSAMNAWADSHGKEGAGARSDGAGMMHGMHRHGEMHGGMHGGMMLGGRGLERMLKEVTATDAQRSQIQKIADSARTDIQKLHEGGSKVHEQAMALLTQPTVDAAAAEKLRQQMLTQHDQVSKRMLTAMLDISNVLTPEQRATLATRMKEHQLKREARQHGKG